jgi:hypothetical protein
LSKRTYDDKLHIDMPFGKALERFVGVDPKQVEANIAKSKKRKPPGRKRDALPGGQSIDAKDLTSQDTPVVSLRDRRTRKRNKGY